MRNAAYYKKGQVVMIAVLFFLSISTVIIFGLVSPIVFQIKNVSIYYKSQESYLLAEAAVEDVLYRLKNGKQVPNSETLNLNGGNATVVVSNIPEGKRIIATGNVDNNIRKIQVDVVYGTGISFHYGVQVGNGGISMANSSSVIGNVHSGGPVTGDGNYIRGDVVSAGSSGLFDDVHATGTVFAHNIQNSIVDKDAFYVVKTNTTVGGLSHPNSPDQGPAELPISDDQITEWENDAVAGGILDSTSCDEYNSSTNTCTINTSKTLGPIKIPFNLFIKSSSGIVTVNGPVWVTGDITTQTGPTIRMSPSLGSSNVAVIADNPSNRNTSSIIDIGQTTIFQGSGSPGSFVFMISQNNNAENGGSNGAILMAQGASALVAYASHGQINLSQSVSLKEVTAYKMALSQSANVTYDTGLPSVLFDSGPGGGYEIISWKEIE